MFSFLYLLFCVLSGSCVLVCWYVCVVVGWCFFRFFLWWSFWFFYFLRVRRIFGGVVVVGISFFFGCVFGFVFL